MGGDAAVIAVSLAIAKTEVSTAWPGDVVCAALVGSELVSLAAAMMSAAAAGRAVFEGAFAAGASADSSKDRGGELAGRSGSGGGDAGVSTVDGEGEE